MPLDAFFALAVPFVIFGLIFAKVGLHYESARGIYSGPDGAARRDAINEKFRTNRGAVVIGVLFTLLWGLTVAGLVDRWGAIFATFVIAAVLIIPFATVCGVAIMIYMFSVHGYAKHKSQ